MAKFKLLYNRDSRFRRRQHTTTGSNLTNYAALLIATIFVVFTACAKSAHLSVNTMALDTATQQSALGQRATTTTTPALQLELDEDASDYEKSSLYENLASAFAAAAALPHASSSAYNDFRAQQQSADVVAAAALPQTSSATSLHKFTIETTTANTRNALNTATDSESFAMPQTTEAKEYFSIDSNIEYNIREAGAGLEKAQQHERRREQHKQRNKKHRHHHHHQQQRHQRHHHARRQHQQHNYIYQQQLPYYKKHHHHKHHHYSGKQHHNHHQHHYDQQSNTNVVDAAGQAAINIADQDKQQQHQQQQQHLSTVPEQQPQQMANIYNHHELLSSDQELPIELANSLPAASASLLLAITTPVYPAIAATTTTTTTTMSTPYAADNVTAEYSLVPLHKYRSKYSIEDLLNNQFELKITNDIDMDPCKASKCKALSFLSYII